MIKEKNIPRLIIIAPLISILILSALLTYFYIENLRSNFKIESDQNIKSAIEAEKLEASSSAKQIERLINYSHNTLEENIKEELAQRVKLAKETANFIYTKYHKKLSSTQIKERIIDALSSMQWHGEKNYIWITDYEGENILSANEALKNRNIIDFSDADGRAIILEQILKVRRDTQGYITSRVTEQTGEQIMFVQDFGHYHWYFGSGIHIERADAKLQSKLYEMIQSIPNNQRDFTFLLESKTPQKYAKNSYLNADLRAKLSMRLDKKNPWVEFKKEQLIFHSFYSKYFDAYIINGFSLRSIESSVESKHLALEKRINQELQYMALFTSLALLLTALFSMLFSRKINTLLLSYQAKVSASQNSLQELNLNLEQRIHSALMEHRKKDKMLIQQSKMAAMGDMISMIAHQWRQPLNQLSYVLMNIEGAYEYKELTPKYMEEKINEGNNLLEFMSHTIDDFRNFFQPDKAKELVQIDEICQKGLNLIQKSLDSLSIKTETSFHTQTTVLLYKNELMQVLLNLINNAKDALLHNQSTEAYIRIETREDKESLFIEVSDNAGGIKREILEKIFEPYFSTKEKSNGSGLGLYMSQTIVQTHFKGVLSVSNTKNGASFLIKIPKA